jgi:hypothetical protein
MLGGQYTSEFEEVLTCQAKIAIIQGKELERTGATQKGKEFS